MRRNFSKIIANEIKLVKEMEGFENVNEEEIQEFYFKFKEISGGNIYIDIYQFNELLNSFGVSLSY